MSQIDFLPENYRQRDVHRKIRWSRLIVVLMFAGLLAAGAVVLRKKRSAILAELESARLSHDAMMAEATNLAKAVAQLSQARGEAQLIACLRHPWSRARIVAEVVERWPESLVLQELRILREAAPASRVATIVAPPAAENPLAKPPAQADLAELRRDLGQRPAAVLVSGVLTDHAVLHRYLAELGKCDLFRHVELLGMTPADEGQSLRFSVRLSLAPGYGQPGGPAASPPARDPAAPGTPHVATTNSPADKARAPASAPPEEHSP